jgi:hypothetical protein
MQPLLLLLAVLSPVLRYIGLRKFSTRLDNWIDDKFEPNDQEGQDFKTGMEIARQHSDPIYGAIHIDSVN